MMHFGGKTCIFSHPVYLLFRKFSLQDFRGGSVFDMFTPTPETGKLWTKINSKRWRLNWLRALKPKLILTSFPVC
ncbi:hypothetical protein D8K31_26445 [Escherichia coli]|nr:hypothetical protein [Escherichia coli]QKB35861.1 hypothetical protein E3156_27140 [Escherichia coli O55:H7]EFN9920469.1 hypothetical protein [Escherichia coli]EFO2477520.1 hypothetical protein [Escherichia coli]EGD9092008.1 hypothetical protein [Escherichia coli]